MEPVEKHSKHLDLYEDIAARYLEGCVNQPVRGFSEISAYMHIAEAREDISHKLQAFRYLYALTMIQSYVRDTGLKEIFEAEAANALICRTYKYWRTESTTDRIWPGIPDRIVNYGGVHD